MKFTLAARAALAACMISVGGLAVAQPMEMGPWHHGMDDMEFLHGLNLTAAQKTQAHTILKSAFATNRPLMEQMHTLREQHINLLLTPGSTEAQIAAVVKQEEGVRNELDAKRLAIALQLRALLTPQQLSQAADLHSKLEALHEQERQTIESAHDGAE